MLEWARRPDRKKLLWFAGLFSGLAMTNQHTITMLAPGLCVLLIGGIFRWRNIALSARQGKERTDPGWYLKDIGITIGFFLVGLLPYIYLPVAAQFDPYPSWGDPSSWSGFWSIFTRSEYGTFSFNLNNPTGDYSDQLIFLWRYFLRNFTVLGICLAALGIIWLIRRRRLEGVGITLLFLFSGPFFLLIFNPSLSTPVDEGIVERFYIQPSIMFSLFVAAGCFFVCELALKYIPKLKFTNTMRILAPVALVAILSIVCSLAAVRLPNISDTDNTLAEDYGKDLLNPLESNALLLIIGDINYASTIYTQEVLGIRPDVTVLNTGLLSAKWYVAQQKQVHPNIIIPFSRYGEGNTSSLADLVEANIERIPIYGTGGFKEDLPEKFDVAFWGLTLRYFEKGTGPSDLGALMKTESGLFAELSYPDKTYPPTWWESKIVGAYGVALGRFAYSLENGDPLEDIGIKTRPEGYSLYLNMEHGFRFYYPENWEQGYAAGAIAFFKSPLNDEWQENVNVEIVPCGDASLAEYINAYTDSIANLFEDSIISNERSIEVQGRIGHEWILRWTLNGIQLKMKQVVFIDNGKAYALTCTATEHSYDDYVDIFNKIINSFLIW
jgi:hypothetical protein